MRTVSATGCPHIYDSATQRGGQSRTAPAERWLDVGEFSVRGTVEE